MNEQQKIKKSLIGKNKQNKDKIEHKETEQEYQDHLKDLNIRGI